MSEHTAEPRIAVMLAGALRAHPFRQVVQRSLLELPISAEQTLLDDWRHRWFALAKTMGWPRLQVRLMVDHSLPLVSAVLRQGPVELSIEQDPVAYRGPGGLLSDLAAAYPDDAQLLVVTGTQLMREPMAPMVQALADKNADVALLAEPDGSPAGLMLIRCRSLRHVSEVGFVDFNEQVLPQLAQNSEVRVVHWPRFTGPMIRTAESYLEALTLYYRAAIDGLDPEHPLREDWYTSFAIIERGATVPDSTCVHDSVVLNGAQIGHHAVLARTVVGPGAVVEPGSAHIEGLVGEVPQHTAPFASP